MNKTERVVKIAKAKGRPMLVWVGKKPLARVKAYPAQIVESFSAVRTGRDEAKSSTKTVRPERRPEGPKSKDTTLANGDWADWPEKFPRGGLLFHGDNKDVLAHLLANGFRGKVKLIYIDPPFDSGADYVRKVELRGQQKTAKVEGEEYTLGEQIQYTDIWANDNYLQFMYERLMLLRELLAEDGSLYLHCDPGRSHYLRCLLEEVFGSDRFINEIAWKRSNPHGNQLTRYGSIHDTILFVAKGDERYWEAQFEEHDQEYIEAFYKFVEPETGRRYQLGPLNNFAGVNRPNLTYEWHGHYRTWRYTKNRMEALEKAGRLVYSSNGLARQKLYLDEMKGVPPQDLWTDIKLDKSEYPTQKPEKLLSRLIQSSCPSQGIVLDCFIGSGTTAAVAQRLGRRWIGCDINKGAIQTTAKRLQTIMAEQVEAARKPKQRKLDESDEAAKPCQLSFTTWRVNDYDLQIQHNEAVELACEYLGVTRMRTDTYFDGTRGRNLVKIVPFNHPLTPLDIEDLSKELKRRPDEERGITLVCLGMELKAKEAIEKHNRNRPINRIHVIELRTDKTYGGVIRHEPLSAEVTVKRKGDKLTVEIENVISPTILQRLSMEEGIFRAEIPDWRAVVDCVLIDTDYDGEVFDVTLADVPAKKSDLVAGRYELPAPRKCATLAIKILDMLGEEALITVAT